MVKTKYWCICFLIYKTLKTESSIPLFLNITRNKIDFIFSILAQLKLGISIMNNRLFSIGDIHGCFNSFQELIESKIDLQLNDKLILLGDYIDRGSQSKEVVEYIIHLQNKGYDVIPLMGNHEKMLLDAFVNKESLPLWIHNGGSETLKSFGINSLNELPVPYINFFKGLPYYYSLNEYLFVHAGFNDDVKDPFDDKHSMIWVCRKEYRNIALADKTIVHGHCPIRVIDCAKRVKANLNVLNLDTGCVYSDRVGYGKLSALELNTMHMYSV